MDTQTTDHPTKETPAEELAGKITDSLLVANLISKTKADEIRLKIARGNATVEDWRLWAELSIDEEDRLSAKAAAPEVSTNEDSD
jgi:hypothetical protein